MQHDDIFRIALIVGLVVVLPVAIYYHPKSQASRERLDRREAGFFILVTLRPIGVASMLDLLAYVIDLAWMAWSSVPLSGPRSGSRRSRQGSAPSTSTMRSGRAGFFLA